MAKGQRPAPSISPFCVSVRQNSTCQSASINVLLIKPNDAAVNATKHPQNSHVFSLSVNKILLLILFFMQGSACYYLLDQQSLRFNFYVLIWGNQTTIIICCVSPLRQHD